MVARSAVPCHESMPFLRDSFILGELTQDLRPGLTYAARSGLMCGSPLDRAFPHDQSRNPVLTGTSGLESDLLQTDIVNLEIERAGGWASDEEDCCDVVAVGVVEG